MKQLHSLTMLFANPHRVRLCEVPSNDERGFQDFPAGAAAQEPEAPPCLARPSAPPFCTRLLSPAQATCQERSFTSEFLNGSICQGVIPAQHSADSRGLRRETASPGVLDYLECSIVRTRVEKFQCGGGIRILMVPRKRPDAIIEAV